MSFDYLMGYIMSISMYMQNFITIFHSVQSLGLDLVNINVYAKVYQIFHLVQEIGLFSLFQNLNLDNASANPKWYLTIPWSTSCQYQCVCKILSKYSKRFVLSTFFTNRPRTKCSQTVIGQNLHKLSGDKIKCLIIGHSMKFNFKFQLTFLGSCNYVTT